DRNRSEHFAIQEGEGAERGSAELCGALEDGPEDRLGIGSRLADHANDLGGRGLTLLALRQFAPQQRLPFPRLGQLTLPPRESLLQLSVGAGVFDCHRAASSCPVLASRGQSAV